MNRIMSNQRLNKIEDEKKEEEKEATAVHLAAPSTD